MIHLTRLNRTPLYLNSDLIEHLQSTPDTVITLTSGHNFMVLESPEEIISRIVQYRRRIASALPVERSEPRSMEAVNVGV
jgi:flagellar protein FlbD